MTPRPPFTVRLDDAPGPARRIDRDQARAMIEQALARAQPARPRRRVTAAGVALGLLLASGGAGASYLAVRRWLEPAPAITPAPEVRPAPRRPRVVPVPAAPPAPAPREEPAPAPRPRVERAPGLGEANRLRAAGAWRDAHRAYAHIAAAGPASAQGRAAALAAAALELEHLGQARQALRRYDALAAGDGDVAEEAAWGVAEAYARLGDRAGEARSLRAFLARYPGSLLRARAEERLRALDRP